MIRFASCRSSVLPRKHAAVRAWGFSRAVSCLFASRRERRRDGLGQVCGGEGWGFGDLGRWLVLALERDFVPFQVVVVRLVWISDAQFRRGCRWDG